MVKTRSLICTSLLLISCATSNPVPLSGKAPVANNKEVKSSTDTVLNNIGDANIVFIRRYAQPTAFPISVKVNGEKVASLSQRKFTAISLPRGDYDVVAQWPFLAAMLPIEYTISVDGKQIQFFEMTGELDVGYDGFYDSIATHVGARELDPSKGIEYISNCCVFVKPKI